MYVNFKNGIFTQTEKTKKKKSGAKNLFHAAHFRKEKIVCEFYKRNTLRYYFDAAKVVLETGYTQFWRLPGKCSIHIFLPVCVIYMCFFEANERKNQEQSTYQHYQHRNSFIFFGNLFTQTQWVFRSMRLWQKWPAATYRRTLALPQHSCIWNERNILYKKRWCDKS